jgi:hypothetical protein
MFQIMFYQDDYVENQATLVSGSSTLGIFSYDLKIKKLPFSIKSTLVYLATKGFSEWSSQFKSNNFSGKINVNLILKTRMCCRRL